MRKYFFISIIFFSLTSQILSQDWIWQNPLPQGNSLNDLFVIDSTHAWATGYFGSLVYTNDGENWNLYKELNTLEDLGGIFFISKQVGWLVTRSSDKVYKTTDSGNTWDMIASLGFNLVEIYFFDENTGIVTGEGFIARTSDGGFNWQSVFDSAGVSFGHISFLDSSLCWVATNVGLVYHTTNSGLSWEEQNIGIYTQISGLQFTSPDTGWITIFGGYACEPHLLKTTNGGQDWVLQSFCTRPLRSLFFLNGATGWITTDYFGGQIYRTDDFGMSWNHIHTGFHWIHSLIFDENFKGWAINGSGMLLNSTNGGFDWSVQTTGTHRTILGISFIDSLTGFCVTLGTIFRTSNGGEQWDTVFSDDTYWLGDIDFYDSLYGFAVGACYEYYTCSGGIAFKTTDGGSSWVNLFPSGYWDVVGFYSYYFMSRQVGYIGGRDYILKTTNSGNSWEEYDFGFYVLIYDIFFIDSLYGWAVGTPDAIFKTTNGGENWEIISYTNNYGNEFTNVVFINYQIGFITEPGYRGLLKSTDGGNSWFETGYPGDEIIFDDSLNGWLIGNNSLYKTIDGGNTWEFLSIIPTNHSLKEMAVIDRKHIWIAGTNGIIFKYTDPNPVNIDIDGSPELPSHFKLLNNYPNPFNPITTINYQIPSLSFVTIKVYDVLGNDVATLVNEEKLIGSYEVEFNATELPSGIYFYRLQAVPNGRQAGSFVETKKMVLLR